MAIKNEKSLQLENIPKIQIMYNNQFSTLHQKSVMDDVDFLIFLRMMSKKGFLDILYHINTYQSCHYNEVQKYAISKKIVSSQASITIILNGLTNLGMLDRIIVEGKPPRTKYSINKTGKTILTKLKNLKEIL